MPEPRPFADLRDSGLLWLLNRAALHPRGYAIALHYDDDGNATGWSLVGDGSEPITFLDGPDQLDAFLRVERTLGRGRP